MVVTLYPMPDEAFSKCNRWALRASEQDSTSGSNRRRLLGPFELRDVAGHGIDELFPDDLLAGPEQMTIRAVFTAITVLMELHGVARADFADGCQRCGHVVRMDKFDPGHRQKFLISPTERPFPGRVELLEVAIEAGYAHQVGGQCEEACSLFVGMFAFGRFG